MKQLNRHILKLLMLFVGLFAISNVGWAEKIIYFLGSPGGNNSVYAHAYNNSGGVKDYEMELLNKNIWGVQVADTYTTVIFVKDSPGKTGDLNWGTGNSNQLKGAEGITDGKLYYNNGSRDYDVYLKNNIFSSDWNSNGVKMSRQNMYTFVTETFQLLNETSGFFRFWDNGYSKELGASSDGLIVTSAGQDLTETDSNSFQVKNNSGSTKEYQIIYNIKDWKAYVKEVNTGTQEPNTWSGYELVIGSTTYKMTWDNTNKYYYYDFPANSTGSFKVQAFKDGYSTKGYVSYVGGTTPYDYGLNGEHTGDLKMFTNTSDWKQFTINKDLTSAFKFIVKVNGNTQGNDPVSFQTIYNTSGSGGNTGGNVSGDVYVTGYVKGDANSWFDGTQGIKMKKQSDGSYKAVVTMFKSSDNNYSYFRFYNNNTNYSPSNDSSTPANTSGGTNTNYGNSTAYSWQIDPGTYSITLSSNLKTFTMTPTMPFYPKGIYTEAEFAKLPASNRYYYLVGHALNYYQPSPEWQMIENPKKAGEYILDFTYNKHEKGGLCSEGDDTYRIGVQVGYYQPNSAFTKIKIDGKEITPIGLTWKSGYEKAGVRVRAKYTPSAGTLTFTYLAYDGDGWKEVDNADEAAYLPFISMVGERWTQQENVPTTIGNIPADRRYSNYNSFLTTTNGFQQSFIQYNEKGEPRISRDGQQVYFNTQWPPQNEIMFEIPDGNNKIGLSSSDLTFTTTGEAKPYTEWQKMDEFQNVTFPSNFTKEESQKYIMYEVSDVWLNGKFKLWSGWSGSRTSNNGDGAEWGWNWNWGYKDESSNVKNLQDADALNGKSGTVFLGTKDGDMEFNGATFYSKIYFFLDIDHPNTSDYKHSLLYFQKGAASIKARSTDSYKKGIFNPQLIDIEEGAYVTAVSLEVFKTTDDANRIAQLWNTKISGTDIKTASKFNDHFKNKFTTAETDFWNDGYGNYETGWYYYVMKVTVKNNAGKEQTFTVKSNTFRIINDNVQHTLRAAQLVKLPEGNEYQYITYPQGTGTKRLVKTSSDGTVTAITPASTVYSNSQIEDFYTKTGNWTNDVILYTNIPESYSLLSFAESKDETFKYGDKELTQLNDGSNFYATIVSNVDTLEDKDYQTTFDAKVRLEEDEEYEALDKNGFTSLPSTATTSLTVPSPRVKEAKIEVYFGSDNNEGTDNDPDDPDDFVFRGISGKDIELKAARYTNVREIVEVELPNVTASFGNLTNSVFSYYFEKDGDTVNPERINLTNGKLIKDEVTPSTLFSTNDPNITGNDRWDVKLLKYNTKNDVNVFDREWNKNNPGKITSISLATKSPLNNDHSEYGKNSTTSKLKQSDSSFEIIRLKNGENHLLGIFNVYLEMNAKNDDYNKIVHEGKNVNDGLQHGDTEEDRYDYYYVTVHDKNLGKTANGDYPLAWMYEFNGIGTEKVGTLTEAEFAVTVEDINSADNDGGISFTICKDYGKLTTDADYTWDKIHPKYDDFIKDRKNFQIRVSYLYPFNVTDQPSPTQSNRSGMAKVNAKVTGSVVKTQSTIWDLDSQDDVDEMDSGVVTGIEGIGDNAGSIRTGQGFIEVEGQNVAIYNASGICIATAEGRYDVAPGVYVVRLNGATSKVLVK